MQIVFCTLNTSGIDMNRLLGGQIVLDDAIYAHCRGVEKQVRILKSEPTLGLSITDNGAGSAFIKRVYPNSVASRVCVRWRGRGRCGAARRRHRRGAQVDGIRVGDLIAEVNGESMEGLRHCDVAQILKGIPVGSEFVMNLVSVKSAASARPAARWPRRRALCARLSDGPPCAAADKIADEFNAQQAHARAVAEAHTKEATQSMNFRAGADKYVLAADAALPCAVPMAVARWSRDRILEGIAQLVESFMGLRDLELGAARRDGPYPHCAAPRRLMRPCCAGITAAAMYDLREGVDTKEAFNERMQEQFAEFEFAEEFCWDVWQVIHGGEATAWT